MPALDHDLLIVGSGPAGVSTWLHLDALAPELAARTLTIERSEHPREKPCGGGLTALGDQVLGGLGLTFDGPAANVAAIEFRLEGRVRRLRRSGLLRVVHRAELDHALVTAAVERGMRLHQGETFRTFARDGDRVRVVTDRGEYSVLALVGADGAYSRVRRAMTSGSVGHLARLLEVVTDARPDDERDVAVFDFGVRDAGIDGYTWRFPCFRNGVFAVSHGIYDAGWPGREHRPPLWEALRATIGDDRTPLGTLEGHPIRLFSPDDVVAEPNVLLTGDAAGVDAALGEGIAQALDYGDLTARALLDAFERADFSFAHHRQMLLTHPVGQALAARRRLAAALYESRMPGAVLWELIAQWFPETPEDVD
jgi:menaquinone-9 beta-reductase